MATQVGEMSPGEVRCLHEGEMAIQLRLDDCTSR